MIGSEEIRIDWRLPSASATRSSWRALFHDVGDLVLNTRAAVIFS